MANRIRQLLTGDVASLTGAGLVGAVSTFLFWLVAARRAPLLLIGHTTTVVVVGSVINAVSSFGLTVGLLREKVHGGLTRSTLRAGLLLSALGSVAVSVVALAVWPEGARETLGLSSVMLLGHLVALSGGLALSVLTDTVAAGFGVPRLAIGRNVVVVFLRTLLILTMNQITIGSLLVAFWLPAILSTLGAIVLLWQRGDFLNTSRPSSRRALSESIRAWPTSLIFNALAMLPPLVVAVVCGPSRGAVFYLLWNTALLANSLIGAWTSLGLREGSTPLDRWSRVLSFLEISVVLAVAAVTGMFGVVAIIAYGANYRLLGLTAAPLVGLGVIPYGILQFRVLSLRRHGRHRRAALVTSLLLAFWMLGLLATRPSSLVDVALWWCGAGLFSLVVSSPRQARHPTAS